MRIDGKLIAEGVLTRLSDEVTTLIQTGVMPTLAVVLVGDDPASLAYIRQKRKAAEQIGANLKLHHVSRITYHGLNDIIQTYNNDPNIHGLIIQRPIPKTFKDVSAILDTVKPEKDVDGFLPGSPYEAPVASGVGEILKNIKNQSSHVAYMLQEKAKTEFIEWLQRKNIVVIGRGETGGNPILHYFAKLYFETSKDVAPISIDVTAPLWQRRNNQHCAMSMIHSQTPNPTAILKSADIVISCVGKRQVVTAQAIKPGAILISVGIWRDENGNLRGDYDEDDVKDVASWYTPTPGGVGPVNVACLMQNLVKACMIKT